MYGEKTKAGKVLEQEWRKASYGTESHLECNTLCFSPQQKDKRTKQQGSLSPEPVDKQQEEGVRNLRLTGVMVQMHSFC